jgi:Spy/CpxP family protein refolding chaperone
VNPAPALLLLAALAATPVVAQTPPPARGSPAAIDAVRQAVRDDKRALVGKNMQLTESEAKKFWPIYDEYQKELDKIQQRQNRAVLDYVNQESSMNDANASRIAGDLLGADADERKLVDKTYKRLRSAIPVRKAVRFLQIENKIRTLQRYDTATQVPLVR